MKLLSAGHTNYKLAKGGRSRDRFLNYILHLAPSNLSGRNVCPNASPGCIAACLNSAGRGAFNSVQKARINKTNRFFADRDQFLMDLFADLTAVLRKAQRENKTAVVRLNGTSDLPWERFKLGGHSLFELFPEISFYDYTKSYWRCLDSVTPRRNWPRNYHLTFSRSETNESHCLDLLALGVNVAVVFNGPRPDYWNGYRVIDGDQDDYRFLDPRGVVVGLTAKGKAKKDQSGFVVSSGSAGLPLDKSNQTNYTNPNR